MIGKLSRDDFRYLLVNAKSEISYMLDILEDEEALNIITYLHYEPAEFKSLIKFFDKMEKDSIASYIVKLIDFGIISLNKKNQYMITKLGQKFLEVTLQLVFEAILSKEVTDPKMERILIQKLNEKEFRQLKEERKKNKGKGMVLGLRA